MNLLREHITNEVGFSLSSCGDGEYKTCVKLTTNCKQNWREESGNSKKKVEFMELYLF